MKKFSLHPMCVAVALVFSVLLVSCGGSGATGGGDPATTNGGTTTPGGGTTTPAAGNLSGTVQADAADSSASGKNANATVYVVGQQNNSTTTDSSGNFTLNMDVSLSGTVLSSPSWFASLFKAASTTKSFGLVVVSEGKTHGKKTEITVTDGKVDPVSTIYINTVGSISGKAFLQGQTDHTGIRVYIPGTSFQATTDASGNYTMANVPSGSYDFVRADYPGTTYGYAVVSNVAVSTNADKKLDNMLLMLSPGASGKIIINNGAAFTSSPTVTVSIAPSSTAVQMMISEDPLFAGKAWEPVQPNITYTFTNIPAAGGSVTLYAKFQEASGSATTAVPASIYLDTNPLATMVSPVTVTDSTKPTLIWTYAHPMPGLTYSVRVGTANDCTSAALEQSSAAITPEANAENTGRYTVSTVLTSGQTYYWCAAITDSTGHAWPVAGPWQFKVDLGTVTPVSPISGNVKSQTPIFRWGQSAIQGIAKYRVDFWEGASPANSYWCTANATSSYCSANSCSVTLSGADCTIASLASTPLTTYLWTVTPIDVNDKPGTTSGQNQFTLDTVAPIGSLAINNGALTASKHGGVSINLQATDLNAVSSYLVSETIPPSLPDASWSAAYGTTNYTAQTSFSFSNTGHKIVNAWYRDVAGNISSVSTASIDYLDLTNDEIVDTAAGSFGGISMAVDRATGAVHLGYYDSATYSIKYATNALGSWQTTTIDTLGYATMSSMGTRIAIDGSKKIHIAYTFTGWGVRYATNASGIWQTGVVDGRLNMGYGSSNSISLAVTPGGTAHISYYDPNPGAYCLRYATGTIGSWQTSTVDGTISAGLNNSIALDSLNNPHIAYRHESGQKLNYALNTAGTWTYTTLVSGVCCGGTGMMPRIALDSDDYVHIAYYDVGNNKLKHITNEGAGSWSDTLLYSFPGNSYTAALSLALENTVPRKMHIDYTSQEGNRYATNAFGYWALNFTPHNYAQQIMSVDDAGRVYFCGINGSQLKCRKSIP